MAESTVVKIPSSAAPEVTIQQSTNGVKMPVGASGVPISVRLDALNVIQQSRERAVAAEAVSRP